MGINYRFIANFDFVVSLCYSIYLFSYYTFQLNVLTIAMIVGVGESYCSTDDGRYPSSDLILCTDKYEQYTSI